MKAIFEIKRPDNISGKFITGKASVRTTSSGYAYMKRSNFEKIAKAIFLENKPENWRTDGCFKVSIICYFELEKSCTKAEIEFKKGNYYAKKPDSDNIAKGIQDAMSAGILFDDDNQVVVLNVEKYYQCEVGETPLCVVTVERLADYPKKNKGNKIK